MLSLSPVVLSEMIAVARLVSPPMQEHVFCTLLEKDRYWSVPATDASTLPPVIRPLKAKLRLAWKFWLMEVSELSHRIC
jgi:hypothetical protein